MWLAVGQGVNSIVYSYDGIEWFGVLNSTNIMGVANGTAWNGSLWVVVGSGSNSIIVSYTGTSWIELGEILTVGYSVGWNGKQWIICGQGVSGNIWYSYDGFSWNVANNNILSGGAYDVVSNGFIWVAVGVGSFPIAFSIDGVNWEGVTSSSAIFNEANGIAWNGNIFVAVGSGNFSIAYSYDGIEWVGSSNSILSFGNNVCWNGKRFVAVGSGNYEMAYSYDGNIWYPVNQNSIFSVGFGVNGNGRIGSVISDSLMLVDSCDFVADSFYNLGYSNFIAGVAVNI
jgi:hypothetical protein